MEDGGTVMGTFAVFILLCNLSGLVPFLEAPTSHLTVTGGLALISFVCYNTVGLRKHGPWKYIKTLFGPE